METQLDPGREGRRDAKSPDARATDSRRNGFDNGHGEAGS